MMSYNAYSDNDLEELYTDTCSPSIDDWEEHIIDNGSPSMDGWDEHYTNTCSPSMEDMVESHNDYGISSMEANIHKPSYNKKCDLSSMESDSDYTLYTMRDVGHHHHPTPSKRDIVKLAMSSNFPSSSRRRPNMSANMHEPRHVDHHMDRQARPQRESHHRHHHVDPHEPMST